MKKNHRSFSAPHKGHGRGERSKRVAKTAISLSKASPLSSSTASCIPKPPAEIEKRESIPDTGKEPVFLVPETDGREIPNIPIDYEPSVPKSPVYTEACKHGKHVRELALELFHDLASLHALDSFWEKRLATAAYLHDIGLVSGHKGHQKAGKRMIMEDTALPLEPEERVLVALLVRYHRKSWPSKKHKAFAHLNSECKKGLRRTAALLRIADALDYEHTGRITHVKAEVKKKWVELSVLCREDCSVEMARVQEKGDLFVHLFQRELHFQCQTE